MLLCIDVNISLEFPVDVSTPLNIVTYSMHLHEEYHYFYSLKLK